MSSAPSTILSTISFSFIPLTIAITIVMIKNHKVASWKYHCPIGQPANHARLIIGVSAKNVIPKSSHGMKLIIMITKVKANKIKVTFCLPVNFISLSIPSSP